MIGGCRHRIFVACHPIADLVGHRIPTLRVASLIQITKTTMTRFKSLLRVAQLFLAFIAVCSCKKDRNSAHRNNGILKAYEPGPFENLSLSSADEIMLDQGKPVMKQTMPSDDDAGGGAICVQDIAAPKQAVWNQILRMNDYEGKVSKVKECKNYQVTQHVDGTFTIKTKQVLGVMPGYSVRDENETKKGSFCSPVLKVSLTLPPLSPPKQYENYYNHKYTPEKDSVTWKLDYDKTSDFDDVSGHWHVEEHPKKPVGQANAMRPFLNHVKLN